MVARENATVSGSKEYNAGSREKILTVKQFIDGKRGAQGKDDETLCGSRAEMIECVGD